MNASSRRMWSEIFLQVLILAGGFCVLTSKAMPVTRHTMGVWSEWGEWGNCTKACGAGVSVQERTCSNGTCSGEDKQYRSCCVQPCPPGTPDFRNLQCDNEEFNILGNWSHSIEGRDDCELRCVGQTDSNLLISKNIKDGTECKTHQGRTGVCLEQMCMRVGCDGILGSERTEDKCLQCIRPGESQRTCVKHSGIYNGNTLQTGYVAILVIPEGATTINITHKVKPEEGYLALSPTDSSNNYHLIGQVPNGQYLVAGAVFTYEVVERDPYPIESLFAQGPLSEDISVELYVHYTTPTVAFEYHTLQVTYSPDQDINLTDPMSHDEDDNYDADVGADFTWMYGPFSECSVSCGVGAQTSSAECRDLQWTDRQIPDVYCDTLELSRPLPIQRKCYRGTCPPSLKVGDWTPCSASCDGGFQDRVVECVRVGMDGKEEVVPARQCEGLETLGEIRECNTWPCHAEWSVGDWEECSADCDQERTVVCVNSNGEEVHAQHCSHLSPRPSTVQSCSVGSCSEACFWSVTKWSKCSNPCGYGTQTRRTRCRKPNGKRAEEGCCDGQPDPITERDCFGTRRCPDLRVDWDHGEWSDCVGECGSEGVRHRVVECVGVVNGELVTFDPSMCDNATKPRTEESCTLSNCCQWVTGSFGPCSTTCGGSGLLQREVWCERNGEMATCCDPTREVKPSSYRVCSNNLPCPTTTPTTPPTTTTTTTTTTTPPTTTTTTTTQSPCNGDSDRVDCQSFVQTNVCEIPILRPLCCASCSEHGL